MQPAELKQMHVLLQVDNCILPDLFDRLTIIRMYTNQIIQPMPYEEILSAHACIQSAVVIEDSS